MSRVDACLFDLDGVLTPTVEVHRRAWAQLFGPFLDAHQTVRGYNEADYYALIDGRTRDDGTRAVLDDRQIHLPEGRVDDPGSYDTVHGLANLKDAIFLDQLRRGPVRPYPGSLRAVQALHARGIPLGVVSASKNARFVLDSAQLTLCFAVIVDGHVAADMGLAGKPAPDTYLEAARRLSVHPARTMVVEDALGGVEAGRSGGFGLVVGVDRGAGRAALIDHGADLVVDDVAELLEVGA